MSVPKRKPSILCCVVNCNNTSLNSPGVHFYRFPTATIQVFRRKKRDDWIACVKRKNPDGSPWQPSVSSRICSKHFVGNEKSEDPRSPSYLPTIFPAVYRKTEICEQSAIERYKRVKKRWSAETPQLPSTSHGSSRQNVTAVDENVFLNSVQKKEPESEDDTLSVDHTGRMDQGTQVNFLEEKISRYHYECSTCIRYIYIDSSTENPRPTCDVQLQVYIPEPTTTTKIIIKKPKTVDRSCGTYAMYKDKAVGPDADNYNSDSSLICTTGFHGVTSIKEDHQMLDLAGVTLPVFELLWKILPESRERKISRENRLFIFLFKMKCGLTDSALGVLFRVHRSTIRRIFVSTLENLAAGTKQFVFWPSREIVQATMPQAFKQTYSNCRVIIDSTEFSVEQPSTVDARVNLYSHYKKDFTVKVLVGCTPAGAISFISKCYGGRTTDAHIMSGDEFLELLEPNDVVLAVKGCPQMKTKLEESGRGVLLVAPPFSKNNTFSEEVNESYRVASVRVHIERIMQRLRTYRILDKFTIKMLPYCDDIVFVCCVLVNLQPPVIKE